MLAKLPTVNATTARVLEAIFNATHNEECFDLNREGYLQFHAEQISKNVLAICHTYEQNGDLMRDPEIVFWRYQPDQWYPLECTQDPVGSYTKSATLNAKSDDIISFSALQMDSICDLANTWIKNLLVQFPEIAKMTS